MKKILLLTLTALALSGCAGTAESGITANLLSLTYTEAHGSYNRGVEPPVKGLR